MHILDQPSTTSTCGACRGGSEQPFPFSMAFQPIVDLRSQTVFAYEALVRGVNGEGAHTVLSQITPENIYAFDQSCRVKAIELAGKLNLAAHGARLSVNFLPGAVYSPAACIQKTLQAARQANFPLNQLIFEVTENEQVTDAAHLAAIIREYNRHGFAVATDDFGAGYSGLSLFAELAFNIVKLDAGLIRNIHERPRAQEVVRSMVTLCRQLGTLLIGEAVENAAECDALLDCGVHLMQGYYFARPGFESLPEISWPAIATAA